MTVAVASRRTSLKMTSEGQNQSSGEDTSSGNADADLRTFGRYVIEKKLGEGGMGAVYRAADSNLKRTVALKILPREKAKNEVLVKRFQAEAEAAAQLRHKNIVCVYDSGELDGYLYIAMEYLDGIDVQDLVMRKGGLSVKRSLDIIKQVARALEHAHEQTIVHRDIKPANLLIDRDGNVKLADMGLARSIAETEEAGITRAGTTVGTVDYMSPEQARDSKSADCRSDMYSLAATWYHMLVGKPLFPNGDLLNKITAHATTDPPDPRDVRPNIPESVVQIMHRMLEKKPVRRYQTPSELIHDLEHGYSASASDSDAAPSDGGDKLLSLDILAGLAEEDNAADEEIRSRKPASRSKREKNGHRGAGEDVAIAIPETTDLPIRKPKSSGEVATAPAKPKKKKSRKSGSKSSTSIPKRSASATDTIADSADTSSAIPSRREAMLARNVRQRRVAEGRKQAVMMGAGVVAVLIVAYLAFSALMGSSPSDVQPPAGVAPAGAAPAGTSASPAPAGNASSGAPRATSPARQPPRRIE
jgi:eukaryotic-like serine/threonine-protein kinase